MSNSALLSDPPIWSCLFNSDKVGVFASIVCAIHCAITPLFFILAPAFGRIWANPATHWGVAIVVVPLAGFAMLKGYRSHQRIRIPICGGIGIGLVLIGAVTPYWNENGQTFTSSEDEFVYIVAQQAATPEVTDHRIVCKDSCCPTVSAGSDGKLKIHIPAASVITTLGGIALILAHAGNLRCCANCSFWKSAA